MGQGGLDTDTLGSLDSKRLLCQQQLHLLWLRGLAIRSQRSTGFSNSIPSSLSCIFPLAGLRSLNLRSSGCSLQPPLYSGCVISSRNHRDQEKSQCSSKFPETSILLDINHEPPQEVQTEQSQEGEQRCLK